MNSRILASPARRASVWVLLFALCLAQGLGLMHRVLHAQGGVAAAGGLTALAQAAPGAESLAGLSAKAAAPPQHATAPVGWLQQLFAGHEGDPGCRLFDLLAASAPAQELQPAVFAAPCAGRVWAWAILRAPPAFSASFAARGPPSLH